MNNRGAAPAASSALEVLKLLGSRAAPAPAASIAADLNLPRSTVYRLLKVLQQHGFVVHLPAERRYGLGAAALELGSAYSRQEPLRWIARSVLARLVYETSQNGHFAVLDGRDVLYLVEERAAGRPSLVTDVGVRLPAHLTASGLAILAALPNSQVQALWPGRSDLTSLNSAGPRSLAELRTILTAARRCGYAIENGTITAGMASVAASVLDHNGSPLAAVALTYPIEEVDEHAVTELAQRAIGAAETIARQIRGGGSADLIR